MRIPYSTLPAPPADAAPAPAEAAPERTLSPRYWPASEARVAARLAPFVMQGSSGSQARAILAQALINARRRGFEVIAMSRDEGAFSRQPLQLIDSGGRVLRTLSLRPEAHPSLRLRPARASAEIPPNARVFNSVLAPVLARSVADLPAGTRVFTGQNGVPGPLPAEKRFERQHYISNIVTALGEAPTCATVTEGGALYLDQRTPDRDYLERVLGGGDLFALKFMPDIRVYQWRKIAANVVNNTLCTLFDATFGELLARAGSDLRWHALVRGLLAETRVVAQSRGIDLGALDEAHQRLTGVQQTWPAHRSSMRHSLVTGQATENAYLAAAIAAEARQKGLAAPLCAHAAATLDQFVEWRDLAGREHARDFYRNNRQRVQEAGEALLCFAARQAGLPESVPEAK